MEFVLAGVFQPVELRFGGVRVGASEVQVTISIDVDDRNPEGVAMLVDQQMFGEPDRFAGVACLRGGRMACQGYQRRPDGQCDRPANRFQ